MEELTTAGAAPRKLVLVEFETGRAQPHGHVDTGDGTWRPFWGWLELMHTIDDVLAASGSVAPASAPCHGASPTTT
jgi:hypothetical protein